jgi:hypothetical protein
MALLFTTTDRASFAGHTCHGSNPAVGHDSQVNHTPSILYAVGVAAACKLSSLKAKLRSAIRHIAKACFSKCQMSASWSRRCLKTLCLVQLAVIAALVVQLVFLVWQEGRRSEKNAQAAQRWEQTKQDWKMADRINDHEEVVRVRGQLQDLRIEALEKRIERLERRGPDNGSPSSSPQSFNKPLF